MRRLVLALVLFLGVYFVISHFSQLAAIQQVFQRADLRLLLVALCLEFCNFVAIALNFRSIYQALGLEENVGRLWLLATASVFVNVVAPSAGVGGMAVFLADAKRRGHSGAKVIVAGMLFLLFDYLAILTYVLAGVVVLLRRSRLNGADISAGFLLLAMAIVLGTLVWLGLNATRRLERFLVWMTQRLNRLLFPLLHRPVLLEERAHRFAAEIEEGGRAIRESPRKLAVPAFFSFLAMTFLVGVFLFVFLAFGQAVSFGTLIAVFSIAYLFLIVAPTPAGLGFVEGIATLLLKSFGFSLESAAIMVLAYRAITFWVPLGVGGISLRALNAGSS
ncbi:MAG: lysylphosphatidylglycerol synthase transmembrane domain-containing protein [Anaerolineales bacterium]|jgi:uncharacterized protein (TIRG00374 family)